MSEPARLRTHTRLRQGMGRRHNWVQLLKFCAVGGSGYVVNLAVFAASVKLANIHHLAAATIAFVVAVLNNFWWNRHWTFGAGRGHAGFQAARFFAVSVVAFVVAAAILELLVGQGDRRHRGPGHLARGGHAAQLRGEQDVELRAARLIRLLAVALALAGASLAWTGQAHAAGPPLHALSSLGERPAGYRLDGARVLRIASRSAKVRSERHHHRRFTATVYTRGPGQWQVSWFDRAKEVAQVRVDDFSGAILEQWTGYQVAWTMARGYPGAFGRTLNAPWVWIPLCLLFLAPFVDPRRPFRLLHLDLLVLLAFGASHVFFNRGEITTSVPLAYPVLLYLLVRLLVAGLRPRRGPPRGRLVPHVPLTWLVLGLVLLVGFRVALNVEDSNVIDVGYAGVIGADRIMDGRQLYGEGFSTQVPRGDTYGPVNYLFYVPFEQLFPWSGSWDDLPAAHGAALAFDLLTLGGLILLGMRLRAGPAIDHVFDVAYRGAPARTPPARRRRRFGSRDRARHRRRAPRSHRRRKRRSRLPLHHRVAPFGRDAGMIPRIRDGNGRWAGSIPAEWLCPLDYPPG